MGVWGVGVVTRIYNRAWNEVRIQEHASECTCMYFKTVFKFASIGQLQCIYIPLIQLSRLSCLCWYMKLSC